LDHQPHPGKEAFLRKEATVPYIETSAKTNDGVDEMFKLLARLASDRNPSSG
jgi:translation initiation factor IF-2